MKPHQIHPVYEDKTPSPNTQVAPPLILPLMIFSGMFINTDSIPVYFDWIKYISPIKWAFEV